MGNNPTSDKAAQPSWPHWVGKGIHSQRKSLNWEEENISLFGWFLTKWVETAAGNWKLSHYGAGGFCSQHTHTWTVCTPWECKTPLSLSAALCWMVRPSQEAFSNRGVRQALYGLRCYRGPQCVASTPWLGIEWGDLSQGATGVTCNYWLSALHYHNRCWLDHVIS